MAYLTRAIALSGGTRCLNHNFTQALKFQTNLDRYMRSRYLPLQNARTTGSHMFWQVTPLFLDASHVSAFVHHMYGIVVDADAEKNSLLLNPAVNDFARIKNALDTLADIVDAPNFTGDLMTGCHEYDNYPNVLERIQG